MKKLGIWLMAILMLMFSVLPVGAYAAEKASVFIPVRVLADGAEREETEEYQVELQADSDSCPMPEGSEKGVLRLSLKQGQKKELRIPCETLGVFGYTIRQIPGTDPRCDYDDTIYRLKLYVTTGEDGTLSATARLEAREGIKEPEVLFQNHWAEPAYVTVSARKTMDGNTPEEGAFRFRLLSETGEMLYEEKNHGRRVTFPAMRFDREGTYRFFLKEVTRSDDDILYDRTVYTITVEVTKDRDYQAKVTYARNGKAYFGTPSFANYTDTGSPKTGDNIGFYVMGLGLSSLALAVLCVLHRKKP